MYSFTPLISTLNRSLFTLHSSPFTPVLLYSSLFTLYSSLFTLYTLLFNLYSSSLFTIYRRLPSTFQSFSLHSSLFTHYPSPFSLYVFRFTFYAFTRYASLLAPCLFTPCSLRFTFFPVPFTQPLLFTLYLLFADTLTPLPLLYPLCSPLLQIHLLPPVTTCYLLLLPCYSPATPFYTLLPCITFFAPSLPPLRLTPLSS